MTEREQDKKRNDFQVRLLIPREWVEQLDAIAAAKYLSRLALIRGYLKNRMDRDLKRLSHWAAIKERNLRTSSTVKQIREQRDRRREYDNW